MIVIMRDAVMPECCNTCVCSEGYGCGITGTLMDTKEMESRFDWCPLEKVEPCEDAVSRQAAIDALLEEVRLVDGYYVENDEVINKDDAIEAMRLLLPVTPKEEQWIPITKRLPEQYGNYLVSYKTDPESDIGTFDPRTGLWTACDANGCYYIASKGLEVIAWKPLPKPYREDHAE